MSDNKESQNTAHEYAEQLKKIEFVVLWSFKDYGGWNVQEHPDHNGQNDVEIQSDLAGLSGQSHNSTQWCHDPEQEQNHPWFQEW